jgi:hypothetical protein
MKTKSYEIKALDRWVNVTDQKYRMNCLLKTQLDLMQNVVQYDSDMMLLLDGEIEGVGKSTLAQQIGYYFAYLFNTEFSIKNIVFNPKQVEEAVMTMPRFSSIVWDEAYEGANKYRVMSTENQRLTRIFQKIRQRNLCLIVVLPSFFDLSKYYAIRRSWALIHCYYKPQLDLKNIDDNTQIDLSKPVLERGYFKYFTRPLKKKLYNHFKKVEDYSEVRARFIGMFPPHYTVPKEEYKEKKALIEEDEGITEREWIEGCLHRKMPIPEFKEYSTYAREYLYEIKRKTGL